MKKIILYTMLATAAFLMAGIISAQNSMETNQIPAFKSDAEKSDWIKNNPDKYISAGGRLEEKVNLLNANSSTDPSRNPVKEIVIMSNDPSFPTYILTGNEDNDKNNYELNKQIWISQHQTKYDDMTKSEDEGHLSHSERMLKHNIVEPK